MTTVINTHGTGNESDSMASMAILIIVLLVAAALFFIYALPAMRTNSSSMQAPQNSTVDVNVKLPAGGVSPPAPPPPTSQSQTY